MLRVTSGNDQLLVGQEFFLFLPSKYDRSNHPRPNDEHAFHMAKDMLLFLTLTKEHHIYTFAKREGVF